MDSFDLRLWDGFSPCGGRPDVQAIVDQIVIDSRRITSSKALFVALAGSLQDGHLFIEEAIKAGAAFAIVNEDFILKGNIPKNFTLLRCKDPLKALQEIARAYRLTKKAKVIAITGSYGKTMVKDLLHLFFSKTKRIVSSPESFNSQIGVALSLLLIQDHHEIAIIEAAVSKKDEMDQLVHMIVPNCSIMTHIGKKHQTTLGNIESSSFEIIKMSVAESIEDWVLIPNHASLKPHVKKIQSLFYFWNEFQDNLPFAKLNPNDPNLSYELIFPDKTTFTKQITSGFNYFLDLINIAVKAAFLENISKDHICEVLETYSSEPMRTELWQSTLGSIFINDTYCEDPQSVDLSLKYFEQSTPKNRKTFIFSGMRNKNTRTENDYKRIGQAISKAKLQELILIGDQPYSPLIQEVKKNSPGTEITLHGSLNEAIKKLQIDIHPDDLILLKGEKKESLDNLTEAFEGSISNNQCTINLAAIQANLLALKNKLPQKTRLMVMVKALAYGTSEIRMAKFLKTLGVDILGVSYVDEGVSLKKASVTQEIFVLNAVIHEIPKILKWDLCVGVSEFTFIEELNRQAAFCHQIIKVHLHVDTGMKRFGCGTEKALMLGKLIANSSNLILEGIMTHFAAADNPKEDAFTLMQAETLDKVIEELTKEGINIPLRHAANSSAAMRFHFPSFNMVRIGLSIYGLYPSKESEHSLELRLALSLTSRVVGINHCKKGETVSYARSYTVTSESQKIAVLPIGYFDGLHRNYSGKGHVVIHGKKAPMVGKICMDYMMVDVTDIPGVEIGSKVLIFGEDEYGNYLSPEDFATSGDSIVYELITCMGPRIQRIFIYEEAVSLR